MGSVLRDEVEEGRCVPYYLELVVLLHGLWERFEAAVNEGL